MAELKIIGHCHCVRSEEERRGTVGACGYVSWRVLRIAATTTLSTLTFDRWYFSFFFFFFSIIQINACLVSELVELILT